MKCIKNLLNRNKTEPERPTIKYYEPDFYYTDDKMKTHGKYKTKSGKARGLIVHYTAGRLGDPHLTVKGLSERGLGCMAMGPRGMIAYPKGLDPMTTVAWHSGTSKIHGVTGISRYCMGMEIQCPGKLDKKGNDYYTWYGEKVDKELQCRFKKNQEGDYGYQTDGVYQRFTEAQEKALFNFCMWQLSVNNEFKIDWVMGHDEVCHPRGRKTDPGGSLSVTMEQFRQRLRDASDENT